MKPGDHFHSRGDGLEYVVVNPRSEKAGNVTAVLVGDWPTFKNATRWNGEAYVVEQPELLPRIWFVPKAAMLLEEASPREDHA